MSKQFVLKKGTTGKFRFNLLSNNGQVVATREAYRTPHCLVVDIDQGDSQPNETATARATALGIAQPEPEALAVGTQGAGNGIDPGDLAPDETMEANSSSDNPPRHPDHQRRG